MFSGFTKKTVDFMWGIRLNNNREWFTEHKNEYKEYFEKPMTELANEVFGIYSEKHPELGLVLRPSRIYKDARRVYGDGPYRDHLWFCMRKPNDEWTDKPTFWFEIGPDGWTYGMGYYLARPITMEKHRARIDINPKRMLALAEMLAGQSEFQLSGNSYKRPKGNPGGLLDEWYNLRSFSLVHNEKLSEEITSSELAAHILRGFDFLAPFYEYFSTVDADPDPASR